MPITVKRLASSNEHVDLRNPASTVSYIAFRSNDESAVRLAVDAASAAFYSGLPKLTIELNEQGGGVWLASVQYGIPTGFGATGSGAIPDQSSASTSGAPTSPPPVPGGSDPLDTSYSFNTMGGTQHITQAYADGSKNADGTLKSGTQGSYAFGTNVAPDFKGAIGVNKGKLEGVDIFTGKLEFSMTKQIPTVSLNYVSMLADLTGTVNNAPFYGREAGEVLFLGASGEIHTTAINGGWTVTFKFMESPNMTVADYPELTIVPPTTAGGDDGLVVLEKQGWDYLWVYYEPNVSANQVGPVPHSAFVERVYRRTNFSLLGIGTSN